MKSSTSLFLLVAGTILFTGCSQTAPVPSAPALHDYQLQIEGTAGLRLDLLLITKPTDNSLEREMTQITLPFSRDFQTVKCAVWVDAEFRGQEGEYRMELRKDGSAAGSKVSGIVKKGSKESGSLYDL
jgi:hypothetical protein